jgi:hypothetical protein
VIRIVALITMLCVSGCSFVLVKAPRSAEPEPTTWPKCTEHHFWAIADGAMAVVALIGMVTISREESDDGLRTIGMVIEGGVGAAFGISALTGIGKSSRCRQARDAYEKAALEGR